jgi:lipopolysaccharide export system protein LptA
MLKNHFILILCILIFGPQHSPQLFAQDKKKKITIIQVGTMKGIDKGKRQVLTDKEKVILKLDDMDIECSKAIIEQKTNSFDAYRNVHVQKGKTLNIYSDFLSYDGTTENGKFRDNVKMIEEGQTLTTDYLDFNASDNSGYFYNGGRIVDSSTVLDCKRGYYFPDKSQYIFYDSVVVHRDDYVMYSDTLEYNLKSKIFTVFGPTEIVSDDQYIYCERGTYNTETDVAQVSQNAFMRSPERHVKGDSLYYDKQNGYGETFGHIEIQDSVRDVIIHGNKAYYFDQPEKAIVTKDALFIKLTDSGDSLYLHADTLCYEVDTAATAADTTGLKHKRAKAYYRAQCYKSNFQMRCDSIVYLLQDSVIKLYKEPILWTGINQLIAKQIDAFLKNGQIDYALMNEEALIISNNDTTIFNQVSGDDMKGFFKENELEQINVKGNANSIYFVEDEEDYLGFHKSGSNEMKLYFKDRKVQTVKFIGGEEKTLFPLKSMGKEKSKLDRFAWYEKYRPKSIIDIFIWKQPEDSAE